MPVLFTHIQVDLDAVASLWCFLRFAPETQYPSNWIWQFVPAGWNGRRGHMEVSCDFVAGHDQAVDIDCGGKGIRGFGAEGEKRSCFHLLVEKYCSSEEKEALETLVRFVDLQDSTGDAVGTILDQIEDKMQANSLKHEAPILSWPSIPEEDRSILMACNFTSALNCFRRAFRGNDNRIFEAMEHIFDGFLKSGLARICGKRDAEKAEFFAGGKVALLPRNAEGSATDFAMKEGADFVVYQDDHNLGIIRKHGCELPTCPPTVEVLLESKGEIDRWFRHAAGFLTCWGSRKSPAKEPSTVTGDDLAKAIAASL